MGKICKCSVGGNNLGQANCDAFVASWNGILFKERVNADGSTPEIDFSGGGAKDITFWNDLLQASPMRDRFILGRGIDDFEAEEQESEEVSTANGVNFEVRKGVITVTFNIYDASPRLKEKYDALKCLDLGIIVIDDNGQVAGAGVEGAKKLRLIPIDSLRVRQGFQQNSGTRNHIIVSFQIPHTFNWSSVRVWQYGAADLNPLDLRSIVDVKGTLAVAAGNTITANISLDSAKVNNLPFVGLAVGNFTATINGAAETLVSAVETADGEYAITTTNALTSSDVVTLDLVAQGFEMPTLTETV